MSPRRTRATIGADMDRWVGTRIRARRGELGISMANLATQLDTLRQTVEKWEHGRARLSAGQLYEVSQILGVHPGWFFDGHPSAKMSQLRPGELDMALQIPEASAVLIDYARLDPTERAAVQVVINTMGAGRAPSIDGKGKAFEAPGELEDDDLDHEGDADGSEDNAAP